MRYIPTVEASGAWTTNTTSERGNKGIHCQRKFKEGVLMLERAIDTWDSPVLVTIVLTGSDIDTYNLFIHKLKRRLSDHSIMFEYKGCTESDKHKGQHQHFGWVVGADNFDNIFNADDSAISLTAASVQRQEPAFNVYVCNPQRYSTPYIPLTDDTLQDAACYISYLYKQRSKQPDHKYLSSRSVRRACLTHRATGVRLADRLSNAKYAERLNTVRPHSKREDKTPFAFTCWYKLLVLPQK